MKRFAFLALASIVLAWQPLSAEDPTPQGELFLENTVSADATDAILQTAIIKAALGRRWDIVSKEEGMITIRLVNRGYDSTLYITYGSGAFKIFSDSWTVDKQGNKKKQKHPDGWIRNLEKDINVFVDRELYL